MYNEQQAYHQFVAFQSMVHSEVDNLMNIYVQQMAAAVQEDEGATIRIDQLQGWKDELGALAAHLVRKGRGAQEAYVEQSERYRNTENLAMRSIHNLHHEVHQYRMLAEEERSSRAMTNQVSEQYLVQGEEMREMQRSITARGLEIQSKNNLVNQLTVELVAAQQQVALHDSNQNLEMMTVRRNARNEEHALELAVCTSS